MFCRLVVFAVHVPGWLLSRSFLHFILMVIMMIVIISIHQIRGFIREGLN